MGGPPAGAGLSRRGESSAKARTSSTILRRTLVLRMRRNARLSSSPSAVDMKSIMNVAPSSCMPVPAAEGVVSGKK